MFGLAGSRSDSNSSGVATAILAGSTAGMPARSRKAMVSAVSRTASAVAMIGHLPCHERLGVHTTVGIHHEHRPAARSRHPAEESARDQPLERFLRLAQRALHILL